MENIKKYMRFSPYFVADLSPLNDLALDKFEENVNRKITIHIFSWSEWNKKAKEDVAFYYEVVNYGVNLYGELPLIKWK